MLRTLKDVYGDGSFYSLTYEADYRLDDVLELGADTWEEFEAGVLGLLRPDEQAQTDGDGCTVFAVRNKAGHVLVGRNFDFRHKAAGKNKTGALLLRTEPKGDLRSFGMVDFSFGGFSSGRIAGGEGDLGPLLMTPYTVMDGINEKGVFIAILVLKHPGVHQKTGKKKTVPTLAMRTVLDRAASVNEAVSLFAACDMQISTRFKSFHFFAADRTGCSAVIEYADDRMIVTDSPLVTNFYLAPGISDNSEGKARFETAEAILGYRGYVMEKDEVMAALRLLSQPAGGREKSDTLWSAVYDLTAGEADIVTGHRYSDPKHFRL